MEDKAPQHAVDSTHKPMPEFPLDPVELIYPGEGGVLVHPPRDPFDVAKSPLLLDCMETCLVMVDACERVAASASGPSVTRLVALCRAAIDIAKLTHGTVERADTGDLLEFAKGTCALCARSCQACMEECLAHPEVATSGPCAEAARACAQACTALAEA